MEFPIQGLFPKNGGHQVVIGFNGFPGFFDQSMPEPETLAGWTGVTGPKELPDGIAGKGAGWMDTAITDPEFTAQMRARGSKTVHMSQEESAAYIKDQYETFRTLVDKLGIRIEG